jgi:putative FmdB family regulatory protein
MPIYEFECLTCQARFEKLVRTMSDESPRKCPKCGSSRSRRAMSVFAVGGPADSKASQSACESGGSCECCDGSGPCGGGFDE